MTIQAGAEEIVLSSLTLAPSHICALRAEGLSPVQVSDATDRDHAAAVAWITRRQDVLSDVELARRPGLRTVSQFGAGYDNIDIVAATRAGVTVCHTPGVLDSAVAELTIGLIIGLRRRVFEGRDHVHAGAWVNGTAPLGDDVAGSVLTIIGFGHVGRRVFDLATGLGMNVVVASRRGEPSVEPGRVAWDDALARADVVSIHVPLTEETTGLIGEREFALMKPTAYLVNTARGEVVDEDALRDAIVTRRIAGAALDVLASEPAGVDHPLVEMPGVVVVPHIGSATRQTRAAMADLAVSNVIDVLTGRDNARVVPEQAGQRRTRSVQKGTP